MNSTVKTIIFWVVIALSALLLWQVVRQANSGQKVQELNSSQFLAYIDQGNIKEVTINGQEATGKETNGTSFHTILPLSYPDVYKQLREKGVDFNVKDVSSGSWGWLVNLAPLALLAALWYFMIRQMQTGGNKALSFGKSRAGCSRCSRKRSRLRTLPASTRPKKSCAKSLSSCARRRNFRNSADAFPRAFCS